MSDTELKSPVDFQEIIGQNDLKIAVATLNAPKSINALSFEMVNLLLSRLAQWQTDDSVACVVLRGAGERGFCAGGDVVHLRESSIANDGVGAEFFAKEYRLDYTIHTYSKPIIVWGSGVVMGGGLGLMAGASHRIVTETTRLAMPEVTIGLFPDVGAAWFLNKMPGRVGLFMALTGVPINAADTLFVGLADHFLNNDQWDSFFDGLISLPWGDSSEHHTQISRLITQFEAQSVECPDSIVREHFDEIQTLTSGITFEETYQNIASYSGEDEWLTRASKTLKNGCPVTVALVPVLLQKALHMSLKEVFYQDWVIAVNCLRLSHFREGVRALLVDKDKNPQYEPNNIQSVTSMHIDDHFNTQGLSKNPFADLD
ncbi:enoyl-CoA hydratase/isomerase family protein [Sessilibacter corallicola]|uniref:3-hydroxyisobutyryl-CoA hydrolase n=1 Tax=Sessilibacter corallicola TaxID=2904075 RepID=A0ABQ0A7I3_9GAMM